MPTDAHDTSAPAESDGMPNIGEESGADTRYRAAVADYAARLGDAGAAPTDEADLRRLEREIADHLVERGATPIVKG